MKLSLTGLQKALKSFESAVNAACSEERMACLEDDQKDAIRAGVIQNFEFTYELSWKFMQRWLRDNQIKDVDLPRTRKDLFRLAAQSGLIEDPVQWFADGDARNLASHTYSDDKARIVFDKAVEFLPDAQYLLNQLAANND